MRNSGQWSVVGGQGRGERREERGEGRAFPPLALRSPPSAFTLIELLVTITIIGIMSGLVFGALHSAREMAAAAATKATIAKLNAIIMKRYESYLTRRVPVNLNNLSPGQAAEDRLYAIRDIMRMEMPDHPADINSGPITLPNSKQSVPRRR